LPDLLGVLAARIVGIRDDDCLGVSEVLGELRPPLAGAHRIARRHEPERGGTIRVLLALDHVDRRAVRPS
jgi:hypothetical protein